MIGALTVVPKSHDGIFVFEVTAVPYTLVFRRYAPFVDIRRWFRGRWPNFGVG